MSYNDGGCCGGSGFNMPFAFTMPWGNNDGGFGGANGMFGWLMSILFFSLFGFGGFGGFGGRGIMPGMFPGAVPAAGAMGGNIAAETAALVGAQNTADRVSSIATGVDAVAGIATANGVKIETVKDAVTNGFYANQTNLCELGNNISQQFNAATMNGMQNHNNLTAQLTEMRFANQQCCCDTKQLIQSSFCDLRHQMQVDKCETLGAIAAAEARVVAKMDAAEKAALAEKLNACHERELALQAKLDNQQQTAQVAAMLQAQNQSRGCAPYWGCNPCFDSVQRAVNDAFGARISELLFPATTPTTGTTT